MSAKIRKPLPLPDKAYEPTQQPGLVQFLHPFYVNSDNVLLELPRVDKVEGSTYGVHYLTALAACQILAGNAWEGYLALDAQGQQRVGSAPDPVLEFQDGDRVEFSLHTILTSSRYWFIVPYRPKYGVVPNFQEWPFPAQLPATWPSTINFRSNDDAIDQSSKRCHVTNVFGTRYTPLVPKSEDRWYRRNHMHHHGLSLYTDIGSNPLNRIALSHALCAGLDDRMYVFVPKRGRYVVHAIADMQTISNDALPEFIEAYQNAPVQRLDEVPRQYLFARFAYNIFMHFQTFLTSSLSPRWVLRNHMNDNNVTDLEGCIYMTPLELRAAFGGEELEDLRRWAEVEAWCEDTRAFATEGQRGRSGARKRSRSSWSDSDEGVPSRLRRRQSETPSLSSVPSLNSTLSTISDTSGTLTGPESEPE